jgi:glyoxylase-like metal-dependent hydrolase (beta-lactamase superfamily II)
MSRRTFLRDLGHGAFAMTVIGLVGCARGPARSVDPLTPTFDPLTPTFDPLTYVGNLDEIESVWCAIGGPAPVQAPDKDQAVPRRWARFGDGFSSGYVLVRGGEATVVDTGQWCVPEVIEGGLTAVGLDWSAVGSVIVTHKHPDHWIGLPGALERAADAVVCAGAQDIPHIASPRPIVAVGAGDRVMDLAIIPTPGHTPGHIAVHDEAAGVLVVGDAIAWGPAIGFDLLPTSEDLQQTRSSLSILAGLSFDTLLAGHGLPLIGGARKELTEYLARG